MLVRSTDIGGYIMKQKPPKSRSPSLQQFIQHWDGKLMPALTDGEVVDRLIILVSEGGVYKLLAAPVTDGKAKPTVTTIMKVINE